MISNPILDAIKGRRSFTRYKPTSISKDRLEAILEAGLWAPSWVNSQPWSFIVVKNPETRKRLNQVAATVLGRGIEEAPVTIVVAVDTAKDPHHYVEAGAAATQNMALAAHSLGLGSYWVGVYDAKNEKGSSESKVKEILQIPETYRVISMLPIGEPAESPVKKRKALPEVVFEDRFSKA
ncbi:MAG: nitroreductase family protein [Candidatus Bathyarchaeia archaeon]